MTAEDHINNIRENYLGSPEKTLNALAGAVDRLLKAFPRRGHFLIEFIQNADDARSSKVRIQNDERGILITNNGNEFNEKDVDAICSVGRPSKKPEEYIGYLGVGFKSVFLVSDSPSIVSGLYLFTFRACCTTAK